MDKQRFEKLAFNLIEWQHKNQQSRKKYLRAQERGEKYFEPREESLITVAKPKPRPCEDCDLIVMNNVKIIYQDQDSNGKLKWYKKCDQCHKKFAFHRDSKKSTK